MTSSRCSLENPSFGTEYAYAFPEVETPGPTPPSQFTASADRLRRPSFARPGPDVLLVTECQAD